ncbi:MAG: FAD:protein FMN transferase [Patescibacteria group bacterium]
MEDKSAGFQFTGIGTSWCVLIDGEVLDKDTREKILDYVQVFDNRFSRFINTSEASSFRNSPAGKYPLSSEFALILKRADELRELTSGLSDPAVGALLELAGYDSDYSMSPKADLKNFVLPKWQLDGETLELDRGAVFDIGGMGKGYLIDKIAEILEKNGYRHYMVDGGGDIFATTKSDGSPWRVAIEYPGKPDMAAGVVELKNQGLAVSDTFRRRWGNWHHIVHPVLKTPVESVLGVAAVSGNAWDADSATSALFFADEDKYSAVADAFGASYLVFKSDGRTRVSKNWKGELFV